MTANLEAVETPPIFAVPTEHVALFWPRAEGLLRRVATRDSGYTLTSVMAELATGGLLLWSIRDFQAIACTKIVQRPTDKVLWVQFIAGDRMKEWVDDLVDVMETYAREYECTAIEACGRPGWKKLTSKFSAYKAPWTIYRRNL